MRTKKQKPYVVRKRFSKNLNFDQMEITQRGENLLAIDHEKGQIFILKTTSPAVIG